ncbi:MAG: SIS domain-containing protein [Candidatus Flexifilum sp.]|jgi:glucosamine--fructose-6-phosphate aminotransferase (isomerizing)
MTEPTPQPGQHTEREILAFETAWAAALTSLPTDALARLWSAPFHDLIFTGCGSAYFAGMSAAAAAQALLGMRGVRALALPASELLLNPETYLYAGMRPILIACSRSGATSETLAAVAGFRQRFPGQPALLITCTADSPLAQIARPEDVRITLPIHERSVVQTSSLSAMLFVMLEALKLARRPGGTDRPTDLAALATVVRAHFGLMQRLGENAAFDRFFFLGGGLWHGIAHEAMLKVKEMTFCQSEAFHPLELRHGLGANADERTLIVGLLGSGPARAAAEFAVLSEFRARGAHTLAFAATADGLPPAQDERDHRVIVGDASADHSLHSLVIPLPLIQMLGLTRARLVGRDPDRPEHLTAFIQIDTTGLMSPTFGERNV